MKKLIKFAICMLMLVSMLVPFSALGADIPVLQSISFKNASLDTEFNPDIHEYGITLKDVAVTPSLKDYQLDGAAEVFVTYNLDEAKHQTGILVTLSYDSGTSTYTFNYSNAQQYSVTSNNNLADVSCQLGECYPAINDKDTTYKLYIPSDMTEIRITAVTQDVSAYCEMPGVITLGTDQEPTFTITVTASDATTKVYTFDVKRLDKNMQEVAMQMQEEGFTSLLDGEFFYQQPIFAVVIICVVAGALLLAIFIAIAKRITIKVGDDDEYDFFDVQEDVEEDE